MDGYGNTRLLANSCGNTSTWEQLCEYEFAQRTFVENTSLPADGCRNTSLNADGGGFMFELGVAGMRGMALIQLGCKV